MNNSQDEKITFLNRIGAAETMEAWQRFRKNAHLDLSASPPEDVYDSDLKRTPSRREQEYESYVQLDSELKAAIRNADESTAKALFEKARQFMGKTN